jgi:hypothetical protein
MTMMMKCLKAGICGVLLAAAIYMILAVPGFLTDEASIVSIDETETVRR